MYYTIKNPAKQGKNPLKSSFSTHQNCKPHARCKQIHKCKTCHDIHSKKMMDKYLNHITDKKIKSNYKHYKYITITPKCLDDDFEIHNSNIDIFSKYLSDSNKRRFKKHPFYNSDYIIFKEITKSNHNGNMLPHLHIILLTNNDNLLFDNHLFDYDIRDIQIELNEKYTNDYNNPLTQTLKKIFAYSTKSDKARISYERVFDVSKGKQDIKSSSFFKFKEEKSHKTIPIHIKMKHNILKTISEARKQLLKEHKEYKRNHPRAKDITIHKRALKVQKQLKKLDKKKIELLKRLDDKLKRQSRRRQRVKLSTHYINSSP